MHSWSNKLNNWLAALRAYSLPISVMSWLVPFLFAAFNGGNIFYGIISLIGIMLLHLGTNIFDDAIDYTLEKIKIEKGLKQNFNFQQGKCACIFEGKLSLKQHYIASFLLFFIPFIIGMFFLSIYGSQLLYLIIPSAILCILYPVLGCLGFGELIVALVFSPLLYSGVFYTMMGYFSLDILLISISTGLLSVAVLHNHMLLDFKYDEKNRKITLCRLCKTPYNALILLFIIIICAYLNIIICSILKLISPIYLITLLSIPTAVTLFIVMTNHVKYPEKEIKENIFMGNINEIKKVPDNQRDFLLKFLIVRNLLSFFTLLICISIVLIKIL